MKLVTVPGQRLKKANHDIAKVMSQTGLKTCADTSFLVSLYLDQEHTDLGRRSRR